MGLKDLVTNEKANFQAAVEEGEGSQTSQADDGEGWSSKPCLISLITPREYPRTILKNYI